MVWYQTVSDERDRMVDKKSLVQKQKILYFVLTKLELLCEIH